MTKALSTKTRDSGIEIRRQPKMTIIRVEIMNDDVDLIETQENHKHRVRRKQNDWSFKEAQIVSTKANHMIGIPNRVT